MTQKKNGQEDVTQLGGDFIVDPAGRIAAAHTMRNNGDHAAVAQLLEELRTVAAMPVTR